MALSVLLSALLEWAAFPAALLLGPMLAAIALAVGGGKCARRAGPSRRRRR
ncbi:MAG: hypothetical protein NVV74_17700 [Magnetospirillum sp.]|nr:hypothetical protein [Magnetospirillum sp.]